MYNFKKYRFGTEHFHILYEAIRAELSPSSQLHLDTLAAQVTRTMEVFESRIPARQTPKIRPDGEVIRERDRATFEVLANGKAELVAGWDDLLKMFGNMTEASIRQRLSKYKGSFSFVKKVPGSPVPVDYTITRLDLYKRRGPSRPKSEQPQES